MTIDSALSTTAPTFPNSTGAVRTNPSELDTAYEALCGALHQQRKLEVELADRLKTVRATISVLSKSQSGLRYVLGQADDASDPVAISRQQLMDRREEAIYEALSGGNPLKIRDLAEYCVKAGVCKDIESGKLQVRYLLVNTPQRFKRYVRGQWQLAQH